MLPALDMPESCAMPHTLGYAAIWRCHGVMLHIQLSTCTWGAALAVPGAWGAALALYCVPIWCVSPVP